MTDPAFGRSHPAPFASKHVPFDAASPELLFELAAGRLAAVEIGGFFDPSFLAEVVEAADRVPMDLYDTGAVQPPVYKSGAALFDSYNDLRQYDVHAAIADGIFEEYFRIDPRTEALERLAKATGLDVHPLPLSGVDHIAAGLIRDLSGGALIHFDDVHREAPDLGVPNFPAKFSMNVHLTMPTTGGEVTVYEHPWTPPDEDFRDRYGYHPGVVAHDRRVELRPDEGSAVLFTPRNLHGVAPSVGGRRLTLSFFLGLHPDGWLAAWS